jgi:hypothetical protein
MKYETKDLSTRVIVWFAVSLVIAAAAVHVLIWLLQAYLGGLNQRAYPRQYPMANVGAPQQPPAPRLQVQPREELKNMRAEEDKILRGYGWADAQTGKVQIPIEEAMRLLGEQGLPSRAGEPDSAPRGLPQDSSSGRTWAGGTPRK